MHAPLKFFQGRVWQRPIGRHVEAQFVAPVLLVMETVDLFFFFVLHSKGSLFRGIFEFERLLQNPSGQALCVQECGLDETLDAPLYRSIIFRRFALRFQ